MHDFLKYLAIQNCVKTVLKNIYFKKVLKKLKIYDVSMFSDIIVK